MANRVLFLAAEAPGEPIRMEITSPGGLLAESMDVVRIMGRVACPVDTLSQGLVGGIATVIAASGTPGYRAALPTCRFSLAFEGTALVGALGTAQTDPVAQQVVDTLLARAGQGRDQVLRWLAEGAEFTAEAARAAGLIDFIVPVPAPGSQA